MKPEILKLMEEFLRMSYPIRKMKLRHPALVHHNLPAKSKFRKVIVINPEKIFLMSSTSDRYNAMRTLSGILVRVFRVPQSETIEVVKKHLHISD